MRTAMRAALIVVLWALQVHASTGAGDIDDGSRYRVGVHQSAPKIFVDETGEVRGFFPALLTHLAKNVGFKFAYVPCEWAACLRKLEAGEIDILPDMAWSHARAARFKFGRESVLTAYSFVYQRPDRNFVSMFDLRGRRIAVLRDSFQHGLLKSIRDEMGNGMTIVPTPSHGDTLAAVANGTADAGIVSSDFGIRNESDHNVSRTPIVFAPASLFFGYARTFPANTITAIDLALALLKQKPDSFYFHAKAEWLDVRSFAEIAAAWILPVMAGVLLVLSLSLAGTAYLRLQVRRATASLRKSESLLRSIFDNVPVGLLIKDADRRVEQTNRTYREWYGEWIATVVGRRTEEVVGFQDDDDARLMREQETRVLDTHEVSVRQIERMFADGTRHIVNVTKFPIIDEAGNISRVGSVNVDMTLQLKAQEALRISEAKYRAMFESSGLGMAMCTLDGTLTEVNRAFLEVIGFGEDEVFGLGFRDITPAEYEKEDGRQLEELRRTGTYGPYEKLLLRKDGTRVPVLLNGALINVMDGENYIWTVVEDISERKRAAEQIAAALTEAQQANAAKSHFLATMSHEFRTPLNAILGFTNMIRGEFAGPLGKDKYREYIDDIHNSGQQLLTLVNGILDVAAIEAGKQELNVEPFDVVGVVRECMRKFEKPAEDKGIDLVMDIPDDLPQLHADRQAVVQILQNLLSNAMKFTPKGGRVSVFAGCDADRFTISISDTGIGIPTNILPNVTEPFVQSHADPHIASEGTGLGLAIVKSLLDAHCGRLVIDSRVGEGTTVSAIFPMRLEAGN